MLLRNKLLAKVTELRDQLATTRTKLNDKEIVFIALNRLIPSCNLFGQGVCARDTIPNYEKHWDNHVQEEIRLESSSA